ncbi:uncharacterized protein METZ01_LOCUS489350 [marine metagenome]|uniref:Uncharacterized protein n=1 Tax=marine metagenome TaxID=408172 RepID=A0A383CVX5_9ZZZZ
MAWLEKAAPENQPLVNFWPAFTTNESKAG